MTEVRDASGSTHEIGPRLPAGQMELYLQAILAGIDLAEANIGGYGKLPRWDRERMAGGVWQPEDMGTAWSRER